MGPSILLKQLLSSLCHGTAWKYAVFWKITHQNYKLLAWEDGYCKTADSAGNALSNEIVTGTSQIISFGCEVGMSRRHSPGCLVEQAITNMSSHLYTSEGIVGRVASTGDHFWIFVNSRSVHEYPEEWQFQIAAGIKTILLVPVQHGVVQLGSLELVEENLGTVSQIRHLFSSFQDDTCAQLISNGNTVTTPSSYSASLVTKGNLPNQQHSYPQRKKHCLGAGVESDIDYHLSPSYIIEDSLTFPQIDMVHMVNLEEPSEETPWNPKLDSCSVFPSQDLHILDPCSGNDRPFLIESQNSSFAPEGILLAPSHRIDDNWMPFTETSTFANTELQNGNHGNCGAEDEIRWSQGSETSDMFHDSIGGVVNFSPDLKLHDASGLPFPNDISDCFLGSALCGDGLGNSIIASQTQDNNLKPYFADFSEIFMDKNEEQQLIDAIVCKSHYSADDSSQNLSRCTSSPSNSSGNLGGSCITQNRPENMADHLDSRDHIKSRFASQAEALASSPTRSSAKSGSLLTDELKNTKVPRSGNAGIKKSPRISKNKTKVGDTRKPRPRDRQLIQDRVKELRELVPQGEKCSIDALLDRAIKHMMFLRSVSVQAEKLKNCAHPKVSDENEASYDSQNNHNGATWACELGSKPETCPILVENLEQPGHLLVEMLCTEYGDFLEIAHVIRHSELVILKGVLENRSDKLWARFIVEVSRGFDRMDILWPLMRLLQQSRGSFTTRF